MRRIDERIDLAHAGGVDVFSWIITVDVFAGVIEISPLHIIFTEHAEARYLNLTRRLRSAVEAKIRLDLARTLCKSSLW